MAGLTPVSGTHGFSRIVPVPSPELEKLPPASPLPTWDPSERTTKAVAAEETEANGLMRWTPTKPPTVRESDEPAQRAAAAEPEGTEVEPNQPGCSEAQELGSQLDVLV